MAPQSPQADAAPQFQLHKRAVRVVSPQDSGDEREKIEQPRLLERLPNRVLAFPFAQDAIGDVRMGDVLATLGRVWIPGIDPVGMPAEAPLSWTSSAESQRSEIDSGQFDRLGGHREPTLPQVIVDPSKLGFECDEICVETVRCC